MCLESSKPGMSYHALKWPSPGKTNAGSNATPSAVTHSMTVTSWRLLLCSLIVFGASEGTRHFFWSTFRDPLCNPFLSVFKSNLQGTLWNFIIASTILNNSLTAVKLNACARLGGMPDAFRSLTSGCCLKNESHQPFDRPVLAQDGQSWMSFGVNVSLSTGCPRILRKIAQSTTFCSMAG